MHFSPMTETSHEAQLAVAAHRAVPLAGICSSVIIKCFDVKREKR